MVPQVWFVLSLLCIGLHAQVPVKHLAGPPTEFKDYIPLQPEDFPDVQYSSTFKVHLKPHHDINVLEKTVSLVVDSKTLFRFAVFSPHSNVLDASLLSPNNLSVPLLPTPSFVPIGEQQVPGTVYTITNVVQGEYKLQLKTPALNHSVYTELAKHSKEDAYIILWNEDSLAMHTTLNTMHHVVGNELGLVTQVFDDTVSSVRSPVALKGHKQTATMNVQLPDGDTVDIPMEDDGFHADGEASDGVFGAQIVATTAGQYIFEATISGTDEEGVRYVRTTTQIVRVVPKSLNIEGKATALLDSTRTRIVAHIDVEAPLTQQYYAYAEVWGTDVNGNHVPVSWIGGMTFVQEEHGTSIPLEIDLNWISMADAREPMTLRNVVVKDPNFFVAVAQHDEISVTMPSDLETVMSSQKLKGPSEEITLEMREGRATQINISGEAATAYTVLVHGYCSSTNPFAANPKIWTNGQFFLKKDANMLNDVFAKNVISWAEQTGLQAYSFVGHSQGGMVGTHMKNYYATGLDRVSGGLVLQTLGTPFLGCSAAGNAANLGKLFGISCGANDNLTPVGAGLWEQGITSTTRAAVSYYTSTYALNQPFGDYCNLAMNAILEFPNDGTTELNRAQLKGAKEGGSNQRWCHVTGMKYPAQYLDEVRMGEINSRAARTPK